MTRSDFSLPDLYNALDAQRQARGLSWAQAAREINRQPVDGSPGHGISASTIVGTRTKAVAEGDGVLQMLLWLNRSPESFVAGCSLDEAASRLPDVPSNRVLRFDTKKLYATLNARRIERQLTWAQVAREIGVASSTLTYLAKGTRVGFPRVMRIARWLDRPAADFTRLAER